MTECLNALWNTEGKDTLMVLGTADLASDVAPLFRRCFTHELKAGKEESINHETLNAYTVLWHGCDAS